MLFNTFLLTVFLLTEISIIHLPTAQKIPLTAAQCNCESTLQCKRFTVTTLVTVGFSFDDELKHLRGDPMRKGSA
jgi:hypothetical protein